MGHWNSGPEVSGPSPDVGACINVDSSVTYNAGMVIQRSLVQAQVQSNMEQVRIELW